MSSETTNTSPEAKAAPIPQNVTPTVPVKKSGVSKNVILIIIVVVLCVVCSVVGGIGYFVYSTYTAALSGLNDANTTQEFINSVISESVTDVPSDSTTASETESNSGEASTQETIGVASTQTFTIPLDRQYMEVAQMPKQTPLNITFTVPVNSTYPNVSLTKEKGANQVLDDYNADSYSPDCFSGFAIYGGNQGVEYSLEVKPFPTGAVDKQNLQSVTSLGNNLGLGDVYRVTNYSDAYLYSNGAYLYSNKVFLTKEDCSTVHGYIEPCGYPFIEPIVVTSTPGTYYSFTIGCLASTDSAIKACDDIVKSMSASIE